jgi:hypothetical protein
MARTDEVRYAGAPDGELAMTAAQRYDSLAEEREAYLMRGRDAAKVTIPGLMPPLGATGQTILPTPYQSVGARGVNNLASKLLLALFPAGSSFVRLVIDNVVIKQIQKFAASTGAEFDDVRAEFEEALAECEKAIVNRLETKGARTVLFEALKQLIVVGNVLIHVLPDGRLKMHRLDSYVVKRDHEGSVLEIVIKEVMSPMALDPLALAIVKAHGEEDKEPNDESHHKGIEVFTRISRIQNRYWKISQEICGYVIPGSHATYPLDKSAFLALRWAAIPGEDYGRAFAEEYLGDLKSLEGLSMAIVEWAAAASKIIPLVEPGSTTDINKLTKASSGQFVPGSAKDVTFLMIDKFADFRVVKETKDDIEKRLEQAFMLISGAQRQAERVTAEEIRTIVQELETGLGGVYSILGQELQYPIVARYMVTLQREKKMPALPEKSVQPQIITGLDGLGRSSDLQKLDLLFEGVGQEVGQQALAAAINVGGLLQRRATALGIDIDGLVKTPEEVQTEQAQAQKAEMVKAAIPNAVKAASDHSLAAQQQPGDDQGAGAQPSQPSNASTQS